MSYAYFMHGTDWIDVIRRIPAALHDTVSFATVSGSEIMAQDILRLESDFIVLRGRMAGSQDAGRVIVLPYNQIVNLAINKQLKDQEVQALFGKGAALPFAPPAAASDLSDAPRGEPGAAETPPAAPPQEPADAKVPAAAPAAAPKPAQVSKSLLLARLRQRLADQKS